jgi:hypothetical protein
VGAVRLQALLREEENFSVKHEGEKDEGENKELKNHLTSAYTRGQVITTVMMVSRLNS